MMRRRAPRTFEEMLRAPEGEWNELPHGFDLEVSEEAVEADASRIVVVLPPRAVRAFRPQASERFSARVADGKLIVERQTHKRPKKANRR